MEFTPAADRGPDTDRGPRSNPGEPTADVGPARLALALAAALVFVALTRAPVARTGPVESDEFGFLDTIAAHRLPMHHTLYLALARGVGQGLGDAYGGFVALDMVVSALALVAVWWWLRALVRPSTALAATAVLAVGPVFWGYGAMAGNYTAIPLVGAILLGLALRSWDAPRPWHPFAAAAVLAVGTGYRQDIGTFWLPVLLLILWQHRGRRAVVALALFTALNLAWIGAMLYDVGGWARYRAATAEFSRQAGYLNSVWNLGLVDAPLRYGVKLAMALVWTLGAALLLVPAGAARLARGDGPEGSRARSWWIAATLAAAVVPALGLHLLIHFGVPGYAFHYVPALLALAALGAEAIGERRDDANAVGKAPRRGAGSGPAHRPAALLGAIAALSAGVFLFYPTDFDRPGLRGNFDLSFARHTRIGLQSPLPARSPSTWRTANSRPTRGEAPDRRR